MTRKRKLTLTILNLVALPAALSLFAANFFWQLKGGVYHSDIAATKALDRAIERGLLIAPREDFRRTADTMVAQELYQVTYDTLGPLWIPGLIICILIVSIVIVWWPTKLRLPFRSAT